MELQGEDLETFNRLRDKYKNTSAGSMPTDPNAPGAEHWQAPQLEYVPKEVKPGAKGANVEVKMCPVCQGSGTITEEYNHRRLEKYCTACSGQGVSVYRDGVAVGDAAADAERTSRQSGGADDTSPADQSTHTTQQPVVYVEMSDEQAAKLQAEIKALEAKYTEYLRERHHHEAAVKASSDQEAKRLHTAVLEQLNTQCRRIRTTVLRREEQLRQAGRM